MIIFNYQSQRRCFVVLNPWFALSDFIARFSVSEADFFNVKGSLAVVPLFRLGSLDKSWNMDNWLDNALEESKPDQFIRSWVK